MVEGKQVSPTKQGMMLMLVVTIARKKDNPKYLFCCIAGVLHDLSLTSYFSCLANFKFEKLGDFCVGNQCVSWEVQSTKPPMPRFPSGAR